MTISIKIGQVAHWRRCPTGAGEGEGVAPVYQRLQGFPRLGKTFHQQVLIGRNTQRHCSSLILRQKHTPTHRTEDYLLQKDESIPPPRITRAAVDDNARERGKKFSDQNRVDHNALGCTLGALHSGTSLN